MTFSENFKLAREAIKLSSVTWLQFLATIVLQYVFIFVVLLAFMLIFIDSFSPFNIMDFDNAIDFYGNFMNEIAENKGIFAFFIGFIIILMAYTYSWGINFLIMITVNKIKKKPLSFFSLLKQSFNKNVFKILVTTIIILIALALVIGILSTIVSMLNFNFGIIYISIGIILFYFILLILASKFILTLPAIVVGKINILKAFYYSLTKVSWTNAIQYALIGLLIIGISTLIHLGLLNIKLFLIQQVFSMIIYVMISAFVMAFAVKLYFYHDKSEDEDVLNIEDHLISEY